MGPFRQVCFVVLLAGISGIAIAGPPLNPSECQRNASCAGVSSQEITGTILIKRRLTKRSITASVSVYQRGTSVELAKDTPEDPLAYERSRVVVYLEGSGPTNPPAKPVAMEQIDRRFSPDLLVVPVGTTVSFPNLDPIFHNIFSLSKPKSFDLGSYDKGETRTVQFSKSGVVLVYCHLHPNMSAAIVVTPNRWFTHVDGSGHYRISDVPPGQYTLVAWHKAAGYFRKTIIVQPGQDTKADFFIPLEDQRQQQGNTSPDNMPGMSGMEAR